MKRIVLILVAVMLVFGLSCGCSKKKQAKEPTKPATAKQAMPTKPAPVTQTTTQVTQTTTQVTQTTTQKVDANSKADVNNKKAVQ